MSYGEYLRTLDPTDPRQLAILHSAGCSSAAPATRPSTATVPESAIQSAIGAAYAHATAPLRRLVDRFVLVICEALSNGTEVPAWARKHCRPCPEIMASSDQLAARMERLALDTVEAALLINHIGQEFDAVVISGSKPAKNGNGNGNGGRTATATGTERLNGNGTTAPAPPASSRSPSPRSPPGAPAKWNPAPRSGSGCLSSDITTREIRLELVS